MPGGLPDVVQRFSADSSGYSAAIAAMVKDNEGLIKSIGDAQRKIAELKAGMGGLSDRRIKVEVTGIDEAIGKVAALRKELDGLGDRHVHVGGDSGAMLRELRDISASMDQVTSSVRRMDAGPAQESFKRLGLSLDEVNNRLARSAVASGELMPRALAAARDSAEAATRRVFSLADAHAILEGSAMRAAAAVEAAAQAQRAAAPAVWSPYGPEGKGGIWPAVAQPFLQGGLPGYTGPQPSAYYNPFLGRGSGGGGGGIWGPLPPGWGSGDGGGGGGGGGGGLAAVIAAMRPSTIFGGALPTVQAAHMITMLTMETLSTVIPAAVAAGAAGVVGLQAGQNLYLRGNAMYGAQEALGGAYGNQTFGTMLGLSRNLQNAQDLAQGGVFGIAGGLRDLVGQGSGAFTGMGVQTIAMIDRGIANMVLHNRMQQVATATAGGTGFLRSFGDIGANIGDTLLNLAPNLPGIGPGLLGGLKGITGLAAFATGHIPGPLLGAGLAAEAGWRWGGPILGGGKLPGWLGGAKFGGLAGLAERLGLGAVADAGAGIEGAGLAGLLGSSAGPIGLVAALGALEFSSLNRIQSPAQRNIAGWQGAINQSFGAGALQPITGALYKASQDAAAAAAVPMAAPTRQQLASREGVALGYAYKTSPGQLYPQAAQSFAQQLGDLVTAGPSAVKAMQGIGIKGLSLTQAFEAMSMAMISPKDIKGGNLDATAKQQLQQFAQTYRTATIGGQPGTASGLLMAGAADYIMSSTQMKSLAQVNQGLDAMTQVMTGGPAGQAALFGMLGGTPVKTRRGGLQLAAPPAMTAMAHALSNVFTPQGAAAWTTFAGPQGMIAAQQANMDQMRTYLTLGAITGRQGSQLGAFDLQQLLPMAAHSPMAQYMLEQQAMQANIPGIRVGMSYKNLVRAITGTAPSAAGAMGILTRGTKATADLPAIAADLITGGMGGPSALQSGLTAQMAQQALALQAHPFLKGGGVNMAALHGLTSSLTAGGVKAGQMTISVDAILRNLHVPSNMISKINAVIGQGANVPVKADTSKIGAALNKLQNKVVKAQVMAQGSSEVKTLQASIDALKSKTVQAAAHAEGAAAVRALNAEIAALHDRIVTITIRTINQTILQTLTAPGGVASGTLAGGPAGMRIRAGAQTGMKIPGYGGGDIFPAMLEPGELVVPKHQVAAGLVDHLRGSIPGFAAGGVAGGTYSILGFASMMTEALNGPQVREGLRSMIDGLIAADLPRGTGWLTAQNPRTPLISGKMGGGGTGTPPGGLLVHPQSPHGHRAGVQFSVEILKGITDGMKHAKPEAAAAARAMVAKIGQEIAYAKQTSAAMTGGLNFGGMDTTQGPVQTQMQSYAASLKTFSADIKSMSKGGLNKDLLRQMIAAGPVQGDALAQSIGQGPGGIRAVNSLYASIQGLSKGIGAQAAGAIYGGTLAPNLRSGTFVNNNVSVSVNLSGKGGDLSLSNAQINQLVALIQKKLLQQGKRNNKTGIKLPGKGA